MQRLLIRARVPLNRALLIAVHDLEKFRPLNWTQPRGVRVTLALGVPSDSQTLKSIEHHRATSAHPLGMPIRRIGLEIELPNVEDEDIDRLLNRHPTEDRFVRTTRWGQRQYQKAETLGLRVARELRHAFNNFATRSRDLWGQFAFPNLDDEGLPGEMLVGLETVWSLDAQGWQPFVPFVATLPLRGHAVLTSYVTNEEWGQLESHLCGTLSVPQGYTLISDAIVRYEQEDHPMALIQLNTAVEWAERMFLTQQLSGSIPSESLERVLLQPQASQEDHWVKPFCKQLGITISSHTWGDLENIRRRRNAAAHASLSGSKFSLPQPEFLKLLRSVTTMISVLIGQHPPKLPYAGTALPIEDWMPIPWVNIGAVPKGDSLDEWIRE
jgi:hypothetical protein